MKTLKHILVILLFTISLVIPSFPSSRAFAAIINCNPNSAPYFHADGYYADPYNCPTDTGTTQGTGTTTGSLCVGGYRVVETEGEGSGGGGKPYLIYDEVCSITITGTSTATTGTHTDTTSTVIGPPITFYYCWAAGATNTQTRAECMREHKNLPQVYDCIREDAQCVYTTTTVTTVPPTTGTTMVDTTGTTTVDTTGTTVSDTTGTTAETTLSEWISGLPGNDAELSTSGGVGSSDLVRQDLIDTDRDNIFSQNSLISLLEKWYSLENFAYSPVPLSLIVRFADPSAICGNWKTEKGETCDDGLKNGQNKMCSLDCLYKGQVRFTGLNGFRSSVLGSNRWDQSTFVKNIQSILNSAIRGVENAWEYLTNKYSDLTSPEFRQIVRDIAEVAVVVGKYTIIGGAALLGVTAATLQVLVYKSQFISYTIQAGDTLESIASRFTMTNRGINKYNPALKRRGLRPGQKIKVKNRHFIEKDYLNQLQTVLKDSLEKRHLGHWSGKIDKLFAKK